MKNFGSPIMSPSARRLSSVAFVVLVLLVYNVARSRSNLSDAYLWKYQDVAPSLRLAGLGGGSAGDGGASTNPLWDYEEEVDEATIWNGLISAANASDYTCGGGGGNNNGSLPTSIEATISANDVAVRITSTHRGGNEHQHQVMIEGYGSLSFVSVDVAFRSYDNASNPGVFGGDVFVLDYQTYWLPPKVNGSLSIYTVVKSAKFVRDRHDGTYHTTFLLPLVRHPQNVSVSLRHYNTCHEGLKLWRQMNETQHQLNFGPLPWMRVAEVVQSVLRDLPVDPTMGFSERNKTIPLCSEKLRNNKQDGIDTVFHGVWIERTSEPNKTIDMTLNAKWHPIDCNLPLQTLWEHKNSINGYRAGDSTMPGRSVEIGFPYAPYHPCCDYQNHHISYVNMLKSLLLKNSTNLTSQTRNDALLYGGGVHHIYKGDFNVPAAATLLVRTVCQIGLVYPGRMFLRGTNPIQQQKYQLVDQTALNSRRINYELRRRLDGSEHKLADLCKAIPAEDLASFVSLPDDRGNAIPTEEAGPMLLQKYNYSCDRDGSEDEKHFSNWIRLMSQNNLTHIYGNRTVGFIDLEDFLLPRPEVYKDKIHDDSEFFFGIHSRLLGIVEMHA